MGLYRSSSYVYWRCKYHIVWTPKYSFRILRDKLGKEPHRTINILCGIKDIEILELHEFVKFVFLALGINTESHRCCWNVNQKNRAVSPWTMNVSMQGGYHSCPIFLWRLPDVAKCYYHITFIFITTCYFQTFSSSTATHRKPCSFILSPKERSDSFGIKNIFSHSVLVILFPV